MKVSNFLRFTEALKVKQEKRVVSVTVKPVLKNCTGTLNITDLQLQEGSKLTGYTSHTETMLRQSSSPPHHHNGVLRSGAIIILPVYGETSTALDCRIYPNQPMAPETVRLAKGVGSHRMVFPLVSILNTGKCYVRNQIIFHIRVKRLSLIEA